MQRLIRHLREFLLPRPPVRAVPVPVRGPLHPSRLMAAGPLLLALLLAAAASVSAADLLVLQDGRRVLVQEFALEEMAEGFKLYRLPGGNLMGLTPDEIDLEATWLANAVDRRYEKLDASTRRPARAEEPYKVLGEEPSSQERGRVSISVRQAPVVDLLRLLARREKINLVVHPEVQGTITLELEQVPWSHALEMILRPHDLASELRGNVLYVAPVRSMLQEVREQQALRAARAASGG